MKKREPIPRADPLVINLKGTIARDLREYVEFHRNCAVLDCEMGDLDKAIAHLLRFGGLGSHR